MDFVNKILKSPVASRTLQLPQGIISTITGSPVSRNLASTVIDKLGLLANNVNLVAANQNPVAGLLTTAATTCATTFLSGPAALFVGAVGTGMALQRATRGSLSSVLDKLTDSQKEQLVTQILIAVKQGKRPEVTKDTLINLLNNKDVQEIAMKVIMEFLGKNVGLKL